MPVLLKYAEVLNVCLDIFAGEVLILPLSYRLRNITKILID